MSLGAEIVYSLFSSSEESKRKASGINPNLRLAKITLHQGLQMGI